MLKLAQLSRRKNAKLPTGYRAVGRPGPLANPFRGQGSDAEYAVKAFRAYARAAIFGESFGWMVAIPLAHAEPTSTLDLPRLVYLGSRSADPAKKRFTVFPGFSQPVMMVKMADQLAMMEFKAAFLTLKDAVGIACWCKVGVDICHAPVIAELWEEFKKRGMS